MNGSACAPIGRRGVILLGMSDQPRGQRGVLPPWGRRMVLLSRGVVLSLCWLLALASGEPRPLLLPLLSLTGLAGIMSLPLRPTWSAVSPVVEGALAAAIVAAVPSLPDPLLLYLVVPPLAAGLLRGVRATLLTSLATALSLIIVRGVAGSLGSVADRSALIQWVGLGLAVGLVGAWGRWSTLRAIRGTDEYREANRLLTQLRDLARTLPTGFDEIGIAATLLTDLRLALGSDQGIVSGLTDNGRLAPLTSVGADRAMWGAGTPVGPWAQALDSGRPVTLDARLDTIAAGTGPGAVGEPAVGGHTAILPLRLGDTRLGVVAVSRRGDPFDPDELDRAQRLVDDTALRLDTGRLFSDVRAWATVEERRRLSREIHDGIAQELTGLGFVIDDLSRRTSDPEARAELADVRSELTRMISELRLSIFDLRSQVEPSTGLGTALGDYVRQVGTMAGLTVHLVLDEDVRRLGVETETELLRIAQEAMANARRHAQARNLWVTLRVDPPRAFLGVADDGIGIGTVGDDSYGLEIMRERAERIGAALDVRPREGGGTVVEVALGELMTADPTIADQTALERGSA